MVKYNKARSKQRMSVLFVLVLLVILSSCLFYVWQLNSVGEKNKISAQLFEQSLLGSITQYDYIPSLLVKDNELNQFLQLSDKKHKLIHQPLSEKLRFIAEKSGVDDVYVLNNKGVAITTSNYQKSGSFLGKNYAFRPYFKLAKSTLQKQYYFAKGVTTGIRGFFISEPIVVEGKFLGVVVAKIVLDEWEKKWQSSKQNILVSDDQGIVILSARPEWQYRSIGVLQESIKQNIKRFNQFPNETHESLYSDKYSVNFFNKSQQNIWAVDQSTFVVNEFPIKTVNWTLYHLDDQRNILLRTFWFLLSSFIITAISYLLWQERSSRLQLRRESRQAESTRRAELQKVLDNIHIGVLVFDQQGKVLSMNDHAEYLLGSSLTEVPAAQRYVQELIDIDLNTAEFDQFLQENIAVPSYHETQTCGRSKLLSDDAELIKDAGVAKDTGDKKNIPVMFSVGKITQQGDSVYLMTVINITKRKEAEQGLVSMNESLEEKVEQRTLELRDTQAALMQKNRTTALGNMAATIVHELSQPLAAINSSVAAAQAKVVKENWKGVSESLQRLSPLSKKMTNVIGLLKSYSYEDESLVEEVLFTQLVQQAIDILHDRFNTEKISVEFDSEFPEALVRVNPIKIDLAISNLLKNAMDALEGQTDAFIQVSVRKHQNKYVSLDVQDNGGGIDKAILDKLFNPYFTTKEVGKGMGLGLSITGEVIQEHDGVITVKNTKLGALFRILLPLCAVECLDEGSDQDHEIDNERENMSSEKVS